MLLLSTVVMFCIIDVNDVCVLILFFCMWCPCVWWICWSRFAYFNLNDVIIFIHLQGAFFLFAKESPRLFLKENDDIFQF